MVPSEVWAFLATLPLIPILLLVLTASFRRGTGWHKLKRFRHVLAPRDPQRAAWVRVGVCFFRNCGIHVALAEEGLYLRVPMAFPALLIPWEEISEDGQGGFLLGTRERVGLQLRDALAERVRAYLPGAPVRARVTAHEPGRCPYCHDDLKAGALGACVSCGTQHHAECLVEHGGCAIMGCEGWPPDREPPNPSPLKA